MGLDWGRQPDEAFAVVIDASDGSVKAACAGPVTGYRSTRLWLHALAYEWRIDSIWAEANSVGGPNIEALQAEGLPVIAAQSSRSSMTTLIQNVMLAAERGDLILRDGNPLLRIMSACEFFEKHGVVLYRIPYGEKDSPLVALALAWHGVNNSAAGISFV